MSTTSFENYNGTSEIRLDSLGAIFSRDEIKCLTFLAGSESYIAAEGIISIAQRAGKSRTQPLKIIMIGLGKDAAQIISRINGFTHVETRFDKASGKLNICGETKYSNRANANVRCYGVNDVCEAAGVMLHEGADASVTCFCQNPTNFQRLVVAGYNKECVNTGSKYTNFKLEIDTGTVCNSGFTDLQPTK